MPRLPTLAAAPYLLVAHELVGQGREYVPKVTRIEPAEIGVYAERGVWLLYLLSEVLSPGVAANLGVQSQRSLSANGAINLHYQREARRKGEPPSLGLVDRVANADGEVIEHREYLRIYESMARAARKLSKMRTGSQLAGRRALMVERRQQILEANGSTGSRLRVRLRRTHSDSTE